MEHRNGKLLIAAWMREKLPGAEIIMEAAIPETNQRADILATGEFGRVVIEYQCANLSAKEWVRRHQLYRENDIKDLWILGGSRLNLVCTADPFFWQFNTYELERTLNSTGALLLFFQSEQGDFEPGILIRFRPDREIESGKLRGKISQRILTDLDFPWSIFEWLKKENLDAVTLNLNIKHNSILAKEPELGLSAENQVWEWLASRYHASEKTLPEFFGQHTEISSAFGCSEKAWQAAIYYRFIHQRVGERWWLSEVETWARAHLPIAPSQNLKHLKSALSAFQETLGAAGMLSLPRGSGRVNAQILGDITTLHSLPDRVEIERLARFRRTLGKDRS